MAEGQKDGTPNIQKSRVKEGQEVPGTLKQEPGTVLQQMCRDFWIGLKEAREEKSKGNIRAINGQSTRPTVYDTCRYVLHQMNHVGATLHPGEEKKVQIRRISLNIFTQQNKNQDVSDAVA